MTCYVYLMLYMLCYESGSEFLSIFVLEDGFASSQLCWWSSIDLDGLKVVHTNM